MDFCLGLPSVGGYTGKGGEIGRKQPCSHHLADFLRAGFFGKSHSQSALLAAHLSSIHTFPLFPQEWVEAAEWARELRQKGHKIKTIDALIAYKAHKHHLILVHADADIDRIAAHTKLKVESYVHHARSISRKD